MSATKIHENPHPPEVLPPPWHLPPPNATRGSKRARACIIGGFLVDHDEGHRRFKAFYNYDLPDHHRQDLNIPIRLEKLVLEQGIALGCTFAPSRLESHLPDFLAITQVIRGPFIHDGPEMSEEVYDVERQPIEGVKETEVKEHLKESLGLNTCGFKSYYSNIHYS